MCHNISIVTVLTVYKSIVGIHPYNWIVYELEVFREVGRKHKIKN